MTFLEEVDEVKAKAALGRVPRNAAIGTALLALVLGVAAFSGIAASAGGGFSVERGPSSSSAANSHASSDGGPESGEEEADIYVYVVGAVGKPGVYRLPAGSRVNDAVDAAGGLTEDADAAAVNLARTVSDGEQIVMPAQAAQQPDGGPADAGAAMQANGGSAAASGSVPQVPSGIGADGKVNINIATAEELETLDGIGPATAQKIIASREQDGPFSSKEDLKRVSGIGDKKYAALAGSIAV